MLCKRHCYIMKRQATNWKKIFAKHISDKRPESRVKSSQSHKYASNSTKKMGQNTTKDNVRMANSLTRRGSVSLEIREMQIKATMRYHYIPIRMAKIIMIELPSWLRGKESACQCRRHRFDTWSRKIPHATEKWNPCATAIEPMV